MGTAVPDDAVDAEADRTRAFGADAAAKAEAEADFPPPPPAAAADDDEDTVAMAGPDFPFFTDHKCPCEAARRNRPPGVKSRAALATAFSAALTHRCAARFSTRHSRGF